MDLVTGIAFAWSLVLLVLGGIALLRAWDTLHRILALDVLVSVVVILLTTLSYVHQVSYYVDAALGLALLSLTGTFVAVRYLGRRQGPR